MFFTAPLRYLAAAIFAVHGVWNVAAYETAMGSVSLGALWWDSSRDKEEKKE